jgi:hypothetical protein
MAATPSRTAAPSRMSITCTPARQPRSASSARTPSSLASVRPTSTGVAPSAASSCAVQRPMPEPPPVTTITWPASRSGRKAER